MERLIFYVLDNELWFKTSGGTIEVVDETKTEIVNSILDSIKEFYPDAYKMLSEEYQRSANNIPYFKFLMVRRFCKCNFGKCVKSIFDSDNGKFQLEKVVCPLRGECIGDGVICGPTFDSKLSDSEIRVMRLLYDGYSNEDIAKQLYISVNTVKFHIKTSYCKLGIHEKAEFVKYASDNKLFNK